MNEQEPMTGHEHAAWLKAFLERILKAFCDHRDDVVVECKLEAGVVIVVEITVHSEDVGVVVGINAHRFLALCKLAQELVPVNVEFGMVRSLSGSAAGQQKRFKASSTWPKQLIIELLEDTIRPAVEDGESVRVETEDAGHVTTVMTAFVSIREDPRKVRRLRESIPVIFSAIGRANGRVLIVKIYHGLSGAVQEAPQPITASGRWCKEVG